MIYNILFFIKNINKKNILILLKKYFNFYINSFNYNLDIAIQWKNKIRMNLKNNKLNNQSKCKKKK